MTTTLIVRDATLAINGAPEKRGDPRSHLAARIKEVAQLDERTAEECVEVLGSVANGEGAATDVLEALVVVGLAQPRLAERLSLPTLATGRRLAAALERNAEPTAALAVFEVLAKHFPDAESLERERNQLERRQGTVEDLVRRYFDRAKKLVREGRTSEAAGWLREVLQLDPGRREALRLLRDLRFKTANRGQKKGGRLRFLFFVALLVLGGSYGVLREKRLLGEYRALPGASGGNLVALKRRLGELEQFIGRNPIWHGAFQAVSERSTLRVQVSVLEEQEHEALQAAERAERERLEGAELLRKKGLMYVQSGDLARSLEALRQALERGGPGWSQFDQVSRDVSDIESAITNQP